MTPPKAKPTQNKSPANQKPSPQPVRAEEKKLQPQREVGVKEAIAIIENTLKNLQQKREELSHLIIAYEHLAVSDIETAKMLASKYPELQLYLEMKEKLLNLADTILNIFGVKTQKTSRKRSGNGSRGQFKQLLEKAKDIVKTRGQVMLSELWELLGQPYKTLYHFIDIFTRAKKDVFEKNFTVINPSDPKTSWVIKLKQ